MKKLFVLVISTLLIAGSAYAEQSASVFTGTQGVEQAVYIVAFNNSGSSVATGEVVVLDTAASVATANVGSYFTTTTTANNTRVLGVADQTIADQTTGRICVRGLHKVKLVVSPTFAYTSGATIATSTTAREGTTVNEINPTAVDNGGQGGVYGVLLVGSDITAEWDAGVWYAWVNADGGK